MSRRAKPKKAEAKARVPPKSPENDGARVQDLEKRLTEALRLKAEALKREAEALEQQTATGDILRIISTSPTDLQPVLDAVVSSAARFCGAYDASIFEIDGDHLRLSAHQGPISYPAGLLVSIARGTVNGRALLERRAVHVADIQAQADEFPEGSAMATELGVRTLVSAPLLREGVAIGTIALWRTEVAPFTDKQIALLQTFADQAVIALENARLFTELQTKNRALTDALDQQTATGEILQVISSSPTDVQPVFDAIIHSAARLCDGDYAGVLRLIDGVVHLVANTATFSSGWATQSASRYPHPLHPEGSAGDTAIAERRVVHIPDLEAEQPFKRAREFARTMGYRGIVFVPMIREGVAIGAIVVIRNDANGFSGKQIQLLQTFADQAVIAIENVRLFNELQASNREIAEKSRQIEVSSQHKSEFLASMSHELRTPLNAIIGYSELLEEEAGDLDGGRLVPDLQKIATAAKHQLSLINDILDLSKIEAGRMELEATEFDLPSAIENAVVLVRERARRRGIALGRTIAEHLGTLRGDERKVKQVLLNLLSNALKFTPEGGRIEVRAVTNGDMAEISIADTGVGIAPEDQEAVFEEFRQVGTADKKVEGTGLGLALSRKFVELHGGRIWVKSQVGQGSTFTFTLPVGRED